MEAHTCGNNQPCPVPPHPDKQHHVEGRHDRRRPLGLNDGTLFPPSSYPAGTSSGTISKAAQTQPIPTDPINILVVLVNFQDKAMDPAKVDYFHKLFFNKGKFPTTYGGATYQADSVSDYYSEASGGLISFTGQVVGPYTLDHPVEWYANGYYGGGGGTNTDKVKENDSWGDIQQMGNDVLDKVIAAKEVDLKTYDNKDRFHDYVDAFIIVHAGMGGEEPGSNPETDLWSCKWNIPVEREVVSTSNQTVNVYPFLTVPETALLGVCCHEVGHLVFGWPDFYDITSSSGPGLGSWCLMSGGNWNGSPAGLTPCHPSAWCKVNAGWVKPAQPKTKAAASLKAIIVNKTAAHSLGNIEKVWTNGDTTSSEYFLLENRQKVGFDSGLPGTGLLIYHVDDGLGMSASNSSLSAHYHVSLVDADATAGTYSASFPGTKNVTSFTPTTNPNSHSYAGADTHVSVTGIGASQQTMTMQIAVSN